MRFLLWGILLSGMMAVASANEPSHRAWIEHSYDAGHLLIVPHVAAGHAARLRYELISSKSGKSGNASNTRQAGSLELKQGEPRSLSRLRLSVQHGDHYHIVLKVYENGQLVAEDTFNFPD